MKGTNYEDTHYVIFSSSLLVRISTWCFQILSTQSFKFKDHILKKNGWITLICIYDGRLQSSWTHLITL